MIGPWWMPIAVGVNDPWVWVPLAVGAILAVVVLIWRPMRAASRQARFAETRRDFHVQRERLEAKFVQLASANAKPNGPNWADCEFDDDVAYVRNRSTGELSAFVAVTVTVTLGDLDGLGDSPTGVGDLIGSLRTGTAVFRFDRSHWETDGRAILNLTPAQAIRLYQNDLEVVEQELAHRS